MKALGITAMILAILAIFIPIYGVWLTLLAGLLAAFSAGPGITFGAVAILLNVVNVSFLSPSLWVLASIADTNQPGDGSTMLLGLAAIFIGAQILAAIVLTTVHLAHKRRAEA